MHLSHYLKFFPYPPDPEYKLLYSTKNSAMVLVEEKDCHQLQQGLIPKEYTETLTKLGMMIPDLKIEREGVFDMLNEINKLDKGLNVSVVLGMACNFACVYCYEGSLKGNQAMTNETIEQLVTFLKEKYITRNKQRLTLDFYGGEPLLYTERIKNITVPLKQFVEERGGVFRFSLVTNGSLLTQEVIEDLLHAGLYGAKVTVDGPPEEHNRLRPFKTGQPSFDVILDNIRNCCELIKIGFGGNYTQENYKKVPELLDCVKDRGFTPEQLGMIQFHPVMQTTDEYTNPEFTGGCLSSSEPWLVEASTMIRKELLKRGYRTPKITPSPCMLDIDDAFVIHHDGGIYKCVAMIGHKKYAVGDVWRGIGNYKQTYHLNNWQHHKECRECEYLPLCFGGCRHMEFQRSGSMEKVDCMRVFWEHVLKDTVLQDACLLNDSKK